MGNWLLWALLAYVAMQLGVSAFVARRVKTEADYVLAGRSLGVAMAAISLLATWFGAETVMASAGAIAAQGLAGGRADPFGYSLCLLLFGLLIAARLRGRAYMTSGDFYRDRFNAPTEKLAVAVQVLSSIFWAAAQALAFGHIIAAVAGLALREAILAGVAVVVVYTMMGGLLADVLTDAVQGAVLVAGLIATLVAIVMHLGGWSAAFGTIRAEQLHLFTRAEPLAAQLDEWTIAILGSLTAQEAISRILATRSAETARRASYAAAGLYFVVGLIPVLIGLLGATAMPPGDSPSDSYLPDLARTMLPTPVFVIFLGALISAILSTVDSTVLSVSALLTRNIIEPLRPGLSEHSKLWLQRGMTAATGVAVYIIATAGDSIYQLIETTSSFGSAGILVVMLAGLWLKWGGPWTGFATVVAGIGLTFLTQQVLELQAAYIWSIAGCVAVYAAAGLLETRQPPAGAATQSH